MTRLTRAELKTYDAACTKLGKILSKASTLVPETYGDDGVQSRGLRRKLTDDSVERFIKANIPNRRGTLVDNVLTQAFETLYQRQAHARREFISVPRGQVKVMDANIPAMVAKLKEFGRSNRIGETAKDIVKAQDDLRAFKMTGLKSDTAFSKKINKTLEMMLVTYNPGGGYQSLADISDSRASKTNKAAMSAAFKYLAHGLGAVPGNATQEDYENARICVDQRDRAHALIQKLQDPRSDTMKAIMKVRA